MAARLLSRFMVLGACALLLQCGGPSDLPHSSQVILTITPSTAAIRAGETVDLQGEVSGLSNPTLDWWMQDHHDAMGLNGGRNCDSVTDESLIPGCLYGYLTGPTMVNATSSTATYHAPITPGVYHITLRAFQMSMETWGEGIEKRAAAVITVSP